MRKLNIAQFISIGGVLTTIAILFQSAPVLLPTIGLALSPISTLPIAIGAYSSILLGITMFFSTTLILIFISLQETLIFLFTTGLLGIVMGTLAYRKGLAVSIISSSITLSLGMLLLTYVVGVPAFGDLTSSLPAVLTTLIFLFFSIIYAGIWNIGFRRFIRHLARITIFR